MTLDWEELQEDAARAKYEDGVACHSCGNPQADSLCEECSRSACLERERLRGALLVVDELAESVLDLIWSPNASGMAIAAARRDLKAALYRVGLLTGVKP